MYLSASQGVVTRAPEMEPISQPTTAWHIVVSGGSFQRVVECYVVSYILK
jgi:hypothetical protein